MNTSLLHTYRNGNTVLRLYLDGTKIREWPSGEKPHFVFPESIDVKITDYCDAACHYCHESSTIRGGHGSLKDLSEILISANLPSGVELAIGGGNPLSHPGLFNFLQICKSQGWVANLTVNQFHLSVYQELLSQLVESSLIYGLGVSITDLKDPQLRNYSLNPDVVLHLIIGIHKFNDLENLISLGFRKVLLLGYKTWGRGITYGKRFDSNIQDNIQFWLRNLSTFWGRCIISFDNLAIEQLQLRRLFTDEGWVDFYMGDDFTHSMYIDAVRKEFSPTSRSSYRVKWKESSLRQFFQSRLISIKT